MQARGAGRQFIKDLLNEPPRMMTLSGGGGDGGGGSQVLLINPRDLAHLRACMHQIYRYIYAPRTDRRPPRNQVQLIDPLDIAARVMAQRQAVAERWQEALAETGEDQLDVWREFMADCLDHLKAVRLGLEKLL